MRLDLRDVSGNASPMRMVPHRLRNRSAQGSAVVTAYPSRTNWYRYRLSVR
jgi:hypothetical protein